ncbi:chalcone isomerase family protein [Roseateles oligotrophus]|uniref:Chalcone isomerase family protein n=1 Tax=Roseateles oligotrophus TaxID=1769250 RepID=A0ABT2YDN4_9BURK|nr:chalcone isomerase family protein [Roseateles oligotrophus]MCV2368139.1 chalcone isomerase family protein [Roseateles oligotrophus]
MREFFFAAVLALCLQQPLTAQAQTVEVSGVKYEQTFKLADQALQLNGAGTRYKAVFQVYTAGLYLSAKANTTEAVLSAAGPKRLHIVMLREVDGNELGRLFTKGIEQNASREEFSKAINGVLRVAEIFSSRKSLTAGEHFSIDFIPGTGSVVLLNGKPQGAPIKEPEFYSALLRIWLGKSPADDQLKDALLGIVKERRGRS